MTQIKLYHKISDASIGDFRNDVIVVNDSKGLCLKKYSQDYMTFSHNSTKKCYSCRKKNPSVTVFLGTCKFQEREVFGVKKIPLSKRQCSPHEIQGPLYYEG